MTVDDAGVVVGSVSGGCVESAVVTESLEVLESGRGRVVTFGYSDDEAFAVGLTCGGTVRLFIEPIGARETQAFEALRSAVAEHRPIGIATVVHGATVGAKLVVTAHEMLGSLGSTALDRVVARDVLGELAAGTSALRHYGPDGQSGLDDLEVFIESLAPPPRMLILGAVDFTEALVRVARIVGFHTIVCDAREVFATRLRFPDADEVVVDWPHRLIERMDPPLGPRDAVCVLTHDNKFDVPAIVAALETDVGYLGALGSRSTADARRAVLDEVGVSRAALDRLHAPIGLDLGGRSPAETAVSICAEIIAERTGRSAGPLGAGSGPLHD